MNQITLINGRFPKQDAEKLITELIRTKIAFHKTKINTRYISEEDIKHSEKRIKELETNLRYIQTAIRTGADATFDIETRITISAPNIQ